MDIPATNKKTVINDHSELVTLIESGFAGNEAISYTVGSSTRRQHYLARFLCSFGTSRDAIHISGDGSAVMLYYSSDLRVPWYKDAWAEVLLLMRGIPFTRWWRVWKRSRSITAIRKTQGRYLHCWYIGVIPSHRNGRGAGELMQKLFAESEKQGLPILIETTMEQNERVYARLGFTTYAIIRTSGLTTYCMRREPEKAQRIEGR